LSDLLDATDTEQGCGWVVKRRNSLDARFPGRGTFPGDADLADQSQIDQALRRHDEHAGGSASYVATLAT